LGIGGLKNVKRHETDGRGVSEMDDDEVFYENLNCIIKKAIEDVRTPNEAIEVYGDTYELEISYTGIRDNKATTGKQTIPMSLLRKILTPTMRDLVREIIIHFRSE